MTEVDEATHADDGGGKCLGILQKFVRGRLEEGKITFIVVKLWISGLWKEEVGMCNANTGG